MTVSSNDHYLSLSGSTRFDMRDNKAGVSFPSGFLRVWSLDSFMQKEDFPYHDLSVHRLPGNLGLTNYANLRRIYWQQD